MPFRQYVELLELFLAHREEIIARIQALLNAQRKPLEYLQDGPLLSRHFEDCFSTRLTDQLQAAHWAAGFKPREMAGVSNELVDPAEMMIRGFHLWRQTRWPGRNGRVHYAHTLFNLHVLRCLELLSMRLWDEGSSGAGERLAQVQGVLDRLWTGTPAHQPVFVRDARWLIPLAQSPTTDDLAPYFRVAEQIAGSLSGEDRLEICRASAQMAGGHLRSQLRHYCMNKGVSLDETSLVLSSRNSNALDFAMTIQSLVPLLEAYEHATGGAHRHNRLELASAICQGISSDPELFVNRVDLLGPYSMIEQLFIATNEDATPAYTAMGRRHIELLNGYKERIGRASKRLCEDCPHFRPARGAYSPYGLIYGFSCNITEHMALKTLQPNAVARFSLEDAFVDGESSAEKLAWVSEWRKLPHIAAEVQKLFDYPQQFAEDMFARVERALRTRVAAQESSAVVRTGRLRVVCAGAPQAGAEAAGIADLPASFIGSSDPEMVAAGRAHPSDQARLVRERQEGMFLVSYQTPRGWVALSKDILTELLGPGRDVRVVGVPTPAAGVLQLMCPDLVVLQ